VAGIVGLGVAASLVLTHRASTAARLVTLRDALEAAVTSVPGVSSTLGRSGAPAPERLPTICHVCVEGVSSEALLFLLDDAGIAASAASSCASGATEASHVLAAMGVPPEVARGSLRFSLGWTSDDVVVDRVAAVLPDAVARLRLLDVPARGARP
jgi:cysteine desulfurase